MEENPTELITVIETINNDKKFRDMIETLRRSQRIRRLVIELIKNENLQKAVSVLIDADELQEIVKIAGENTEIKNFLKIFVLATKTDERFPEILSMLLASETLYLDNGFYFLITKKLLENYNSYHLTEVAGKKIFDNHNEKTDSVKFTPQTYNICEPEDFFDVIEDMYNKCEFNSLIRRHYEINTFQGFRYASSAIKIIDDAINQLANSANKTKQVEAAILKEVYCKAQHNDFSQAKLLDDLGLKKSNFYKIKKSAITELAQIIFPAGNDINGELKNLLDEWNRNKCSDNPSEIIEVIAGGDSREEVATKLAKALTESHEASSR